MSFFYKIPKTYCLIIGLFCFPLLVNCQKIKLELTLDEVSIDARSPGMAGCIFDAFGPDFRWEWTGRVDIDDISAVLTNGTYYEEDLGSDFDPTTNFTINNSLINREFNLPDDNGASPLSLSENIVFTLTLGGREIDGDPGGDDDDCVSSSSFPITIQDDASGVAKSITANIGGYLFKFSYKYTLTEPIQGLELRNFQNDAVANVLCAGTKVNVVAISDGFESGNYQFKRAPKGTDVYENIGEAGTATSIEVNVEDLNLYNYSVTSIAGGGFLGDNVQVVSNFGDILIAPSFPEEIPTTTVGSCANAMNGSVTYTGLANNLPGNAQIRLSLEGAGINRTSSFMAASSPFTFNELPAGDYSLYVTVVPSGVATSNCTTDCPIKIEEIDLPDIAIIENVSPMCDELTGEITVSFRAGSVVAYTVQDQVSAGIQEFRDPANIEFELSPISPGNYLLFAESSEGCVTDGIPFAIASPPLSASGTVLKRSVSDNFDIECFEGEIFVNATAPVDEGNYTVQLEGDANIRNLLPGRSFDYLLGAGDYRIVFTRLNSGCTFIEEITVTENPNVIGLNTGDNLPPTACQANAGSFRVIATNGTAPYRFDLEGGATSGDIMEPNFEFTGLATGNYSVTVTDRYNCTAETTTSIAATPDGLALVNDGVVAPICFDEALGSSISIAASGGVEPYQFTWSDPGFTPSNRQNNIFAGSYTVTLTDADDCETSLLVTVPDGRPVTYATVPTDTTLCQGNIYVLDLSNYPGSAITGPNDFSSIEAVSLLEDAGEYQVSFVDDLGCDTVFTSTITHTDEAFTARMVLPTDAVVSMPVAILEASFPQPGTVEWVVDESLVTKIAEDDNVHFFEFSEPGEYKVGMIAEYGGCEDVVVKKITMHADSTTIPGPVLTGRVIEQVNIAPNPNNGVFRVDTELNSPVALTLTFYNNNGTQLDRRTIENQETISENYSYDLNPGNYYLQVQAGNERRILSVVVQ